MPWSPVPAWCAQASGGQKKEILKAIESMARKSRFGDDMVEAFQEMAAYLRGEIECESYELPDDILTADRIKAIRRSVASSTKSFEREFRIPARTIEGLEQGRRSPDAATALLFRVLEREPDAVRRCLQ
jgi:putative transcriptional regulator